jgi:hypothetical protein
MKRRRNRLRRRYGRSAGRLYRVVWKRDDRGTSGVLAPGPFTHAEAVTVLSKITKYPWRRVLLEEV